MAANAGMISEAMYYVLLALKNTRRSLPLAKAAEAESNHRIKIGPATMYGVLSRLKKNKWIVLEQRTGEYELTPTGEAVLEQEYLRLMSMLRDGMNRIKGEGHEKNHL